MKLRALFAAAAAAFLLATGAGAVSLEQVQPVMPRIDVYVHDSGTPLESLAPEDISATLDGAPLEVESLRPSDQGIFYVFLLDISRSISEAHIAAAREAVLSTYRQMGQNDQLALISFGNEVNTLLRGGESASQVEAALDTIHSTDNNTRFYDAMNTLVETASARNDMRRVAVVVSDGVDDTDAGMTQEELEAVLRQSGVAVYALAVDSADQTVQDHFRDFIRLSGGDLFSFSPENAAEKLNELQLCIDEIWHLQLTAPSNIADGQEHRLSVRFGQLDTLELDIRPTQWVPDEKPPYPLSVNAGDGTVTVRFSEAMANPGDAQCYVLKNPSGKTVSFTVSSAESTCAVLSCPELTDPTGWTLELSGLTDASMEANALAPCSLPLAEAVTAPSTEAAAQQQAAKSELIRLLLMAGGALAAAAVVVFLLLARKRRPKDASPKPAKKPKANRRGAENVTFFFESDDHSDRT